MTKRSIEYYNQAQSKRIELAVVEYILNQEDDLNELYLPEEFVEVDIVVDVVEFITQ